MIEEVSISDLFYRTQLNGIIISRALRTNNRKLVSVCQPCFRQIYIHVLSSLKLDRLKWYFTLNLEVFDYLAFFRSKRYIRRRTRN